MSKAIILKSPDEIEILETANQIVAETLSMLGKKIGPGISTWQLDCWAEKFAIERGSVPAFKGYRGFPCSLCVSINEEVVHGIPSQKVLIQEGDIVSVDFGVKYKGYFGDAAITIPVGPIDGVKARLVAVTREALLAGISQVRVGNRINDISGAVQDYVEKNGFSVVRQFVGHGIGARLHEAPEIPNYRRRERTARLLPGMVLAIEPMVNVGTYKVIVMKDGWTVLTADRSPSAHFEHSVLVTEAGPVILGQTKNR